ncbi:MAG: leucyl aminopeptidase [Alphaproteobacteria bacterium]
MKIAFSEPKAVGKHWVAVAVAGDRVLRGHAADLNGRHGDIVARTIQAVGFKAERAKTTAIVTPGPGELKGIILVGLGNPDELTAEHFAHIGGALVAQASGVNAADLTVALDDDGCGPVAGADAAANLALGMQLRAYRFTTSRTTKTTGAPALKKATIQLSGAAAARKAHADLDKVAAAVAFTRDIVTEPANVLYPDSYARIIDETLTPLGVKVEILDEKDMEKLGMGSLLGVGMGSAKPPRLVVMQWQGVKGQGAKARGKKPLAFVGKGVTFDTGGISIKPSAGMEDMKWDMGGSAAVVGLMHALAGRKAKVNAVGIVGLVENMPSGTAQRPGDVVKSMSGQTIEVLNTDAEGRLVLADALWYCQDRFQPRFMIDLATLTGAIMVALGKEMAGLYSNRDELADALLKAGEATGERCWRMPLDEAYDRQIDGDISDVKNISAGRWGGSITAAQFLQRFTNGLPWAHLDIAGTAWTDKDRPLAPKGATAFGVRMLNAFVAANYE